MSNQVSSSLYLPLINSLSLRPSSNSLVYLIREHRLADYLKKKEEQQQKRQCFYPIRINIPSTFENDISNMNDQDFLNMDNQDFLNKYNDE